MKSRTAFQSARNSDKIASVDVISSLQVEIAKTEESKQNCDHLVIPPIGGQVYIYLAEFWRLSGPDLVLTAIQDRDQETKLGKEVDAPEDTSPALMHNFRQIGKGIVFPWSRA